MLVTCETIRYVTSSAVESKTLVVFTNVQLSLPIRHALEVGLDYPQPPTSLKLDDSITIGFARKNTRMKDLSLGMCGVANSEIRKHKS